LAQSVNLLLKLVRDTGAPQMVMATGGQYQQTLPQGRSFQLLRLRIDPAAGLIPEISGNRLMVSVRMLRESGSDKLPAMTSEDTSFELTLCA
jgi:cell division protein ZapD